MEHSKNNKQSKKRPLIVTIICIAGFTMVPFVFFRLLLVPEISTKLAKLYGKSFVPKTILFTLTSLIALIGFWKMKKWGVYLYTLITTVVVIDAFIFQLYGTMGYIGPIVIAIIGFINIKKMETVAKKSGHLC